MSDEDNDKPDKRSIAAIGWQKQTTLGVASNTPNTFWHWMNGDGRTIYTMTDESDKRLTKSDLEAIATRAGRGWHAPSDLMLGGEQSDQERNIARRAYADVHTLLSEIYRLRRVIKGYRRLLEQHIANDAGETDE